MDRRGVDMRGRPLADHEDHKAVAMRMHIPRGGGKRPGGSTTRSCFAMVMERVRGEECDGVPDTEWGCASVI